MLSILGCLCFLAIGGTFIDKGNDPKEAPWHDKKVALLTTGSFSILNSFIYLVDAVFSAYKGYKGQ